MYVQGEHFYSLSSGPFYDTPEDKDMTEKEKLTKQTQRRSRGFAGKQEAAFMQVSYKITVLPCLSLST